MTGLAIWAPKRPPIFFMHIPKTAGMALRLFLGNQYSISQIMPAAGWTELLSLDVRDIGKYRLFQGHFGYGILDLLPPDVRPVVFLRDPVARTISHLKHLRRDPNFHPAHRLAAGRTLDELVRDDRIMSLCCNVQIGQFSSDIPAATILAGLRREQESGGTPNPDAYASKPDLKKAEGALDRFHYVGFVEDLQQDILQMSLVLGLHAPHQLPRLNDDPDKVAEAAGIAPDTLARLRERNALDIAFYEAARRRPRLSWDAVASALIDRPGYAPILLPIDFPMSGPIPGSNWYECEESEEGPFRWTGPAEMTILDLPLAQGCRYEMSLFLSMPEIDQLSVAAGGIDLPVERQWSEGSRHRIAIHVPAEAVRERGLTSIRFRTRVFRAAEPDLRMLAFAVRELRISRVAPAPLIKIGQRPSRVEEAPAIGAPPARGTPIALPQPVEFQTNGLPLDANSKVALLGEPVGVFPDGWVRAHAALRFRALAAIASIALELWAPPGNEPLTVTLRVNGAPGSTVTTARRAAAILASPVSATLAAEFSIELLADHEQQLSDNDRRHAAYVLRRISFS